jgi:hypothetical protein
MRAASGALPAGTIGSVVVVVAIVVVVVEVVAALDEEGFPVLDESFEHALNASTATRGAVMDRTRLGISPT